MKVTPHGLPSVDSLEFPLRQDCPREDVVAHADLVPGDFDALLAALALAPVEIGIAVPEYAARQAWEEGVLNPRRGMYSIIGRAHATVVGAPDRHTVDVVLKFSMTDGFYQAFNTSARVGFSENTLPDNTPLPDVDGVIAPAKRSRRVSGDA